MLIALIRKDLRVCRLPIFAGVLLLVGPFAMSAAIVTNMPLWQESTTASAWAVLLGTGCHFSLFCSQATLAMLSGNIIAAERADGSAEFLAYLPPSRRRILISKLIVIGGCALVIWGSNALVGVVADRLAGDTEAARMLTSDLVPLHYLAAIGIAAMGGGWCASARLENTGPSVALAFASPLLVLGALSLTQYLTNWPDQMEFARVYFTSCTMVGATEFLAGTVYFLHRVEP